MRRFNKYMSTSVAVVFCSMFGSALAAGPNPADVVSPNRCEVIGLVDNCPSQKTLKVTRMDGRYFDVSKDTSSIKEACLKRAEEFNQWCKSTKPITARFFQNNNLIEEKTFIPTQKK